MNEKEIRGWFDTVDCVSYDALSDSYYARLPSGKELWCDCPVTLADVLMRLDETQERRDETRAIVVSLLLSALALALAAALAAILN